MIRCLALVLFEQSTTAYGTLLHKRNALTNMSKLALVILSFVGSDRTVPPTYFIIFC
jgi:hypothetical protein